MQNKKLDYQVMSAGYCKHPECTTIKGGRWLSQKYPALCALIKHPDFGYILFDTGYSERFFEETKKWPFLLYRKVTPVTIEKEGTLQFQLNKMGIKKEEISIIILSHFHADHIGGMKDFPNAKIFFNKFAYEDVSNKKGIKALLKGYLENLLPKDFLARANFIEDAKKIDLHSSLKPFNYGHDLLEDGSIMAIPLPGHATGQIGIFFHHEDRAVFFVADSCWSSRAYRENRPPHFVTYLIHSQRKEYLQTLQNLHLLYKNNSNIDIIPSHCPEVWQSIKERGGLR